MRSWFVHNCIGHPAMQILNMLGRPDWADYIHDRTLPEESS